MFPIVGVGASAGGVEALEGFFQAVPPQPGLAFIVVTHLSPDRESLLHEIIGRHTDLTVAVAKDGVEVQPNCVYVLPADAIISVEAGVLQLRKSVDGRRERKPIDILFSSLAIDRGEYAASVVLSGGDGDGTLGTKAIKERGGLTLAQVTDGHGPRHPDMPQSAISTGFVDFAVPAHEMGPRLAEFARLLAGADDAVETDAEHAAKTLSEICAVLRNQLGHDFSGYKTKTFFRRVQRRMQVTQQRSADAYIALLKQDPKEAGALFRDLLINVTNFFRDAEAFDALRRLVIPKLFEGRGAEDSVRVWVPGCATGEEVYSIAILLREHMDTLTALPRVQVFATDIDEHALGVARAGRYPEALLDSVSPARRERFFTADAGSFVLTKEIRDLCIFSPHSVIRDPPFSRLDLVSCRNLLIYFGPEVQNQVLPMFHYALREGGFLFLGLSESTGKFGDLFSPLDKKQRIYRSRDSVGLTPRLPVSLRSHPALAPPGPDRRLAGTVPGAALRQAVEAQVLERYSPAHVLVTRDGDVVHFSARTSKYLEFAAGAPTRQLMTLARKGLRLDLRAAFREAIESGRAVVREGVPVTADDGRLQIVDVTVEPLAERHNGEPLYIVLFIDQGQMLSAEEAETRVNAPETGATTLLERDLRETKERLQSLIEEYETALEELRSSNEELLSVNEELQSSNEEMEASKEELQSLNEELNTVNIELTGKIEELDRANSDLRNIFESTQIPTIFLDRDLTIRSFTPAVKTLFSILPSDRGRPITDLASRLSLPGFIDDIQAVLDTGTVIERQAHHPEAGAHFILRLAPYRTAGGQVEGVVITFLDVTSLTNAQTHQQVLIAELNHRVKNMLMIAIGIAQQTHKSSPSPEAFLEAFVGRLQAMARSYELLSRENWTEGSVDELIRTELTPFGLERLSIDGPCLMLKPKQALSLGMVLHELATNAGKHGALSAPNGTVSINWSRAAANGGDHLELLWREVDGPSTEAPSRRGFGLRLIEREISYNLGGRSKVDFADGGLRAEIAFPLEDV
jgi:two-component system CheB/CheR fusion protein